MAIGIELSVGTMNKSLLETCRGLRKRCRRGRRNEGGAGSDVVTELQLVHESQTLLIGERYLCGSACTVVARGKLPGPEKRVLLGLLEQIRALTSDFSLFDSMSDVQHTPMGTGSYRNAVLYLKQI